MRTTGRGEWGAAACRMVICLLLVTLTGCDDTIDLPNRAPAVAFQQIEAVGGDLAVYYRVLDYDGDEVAVVLQACQGGQCRAPTAAPGGDGTTHLPTEPGRPVLHLFVWSAACDLDEAALAQEWTIVIAPSDEDAEGPVQTSDPFRPSELGVVPGCGS